MRLNRRDFLRDSAALTALLASTQNIVSAQPATSRPVQPSERLRVAVIGIGGRGKDHLKGFAGQNGCEVAIICDADEDETNIGRCSTAVEKEQGKAPKFVKDLRKALDDKSIDIVSIATPNHWHALAAIWALQAGKHVYVEKPVSHNVSEGRRIVEAARKYDKICQTGTQSRSSTGMREAMAFLHAGKIGKVTLARGLCYKLRPSIGKVDGVQQPPKTVDYDIWCGPAPMDPIKRKRFHYDWHWIWNYGNGDLGNQGIHEMDKARWGLNKNELPKSVLSLGGRFGYIDDGETANTQICVFDYGDTQLIFEVRGLPSKSPYPGKESPQTKVTPSPFVGNVWIGTEGFLVCPSYTGGVAYSKDGQILARFQGPEAHFANFVKAVRSGRKEDLNADILEGHLSSALCHLGNISYRLGEEVPFSKQTNALGDNKEAVATFQSMEEHLKDHSLKLNEVNYRLGKKLVIDPKTETFIGDEPANLMLTRPYRKGYEVPAKIA
jgi:predicted dehydrogenase